MSRTELPTIAANQVDVPALQSFLQKNIGGEVRFDRLSRALYSTDASVYQIVPLGVVLPRTEKDIVTVVEACGRFGVPLTARGGGTSQAGQCIGPGLVLDCSKHFNRILESQCCRALCTSSTGLRARRSERGAETARPAIPAGHFHLEPGDHRRHDRQQFVGDAFRRLRQDHRPRSRP